MKRIIARLTTIILLATVAGQALCQQSQRPLRNRKVVVLPWVYLHGSTRAARTARETVSAVLRNAGADLVPESSLPSAWEHAGLGAWPDAPKKPVELAAALSFGKSLHADYLVMGTASWRDRTVWVSLGPKNKSDCTVSCQIVDVQTGETWFEARNVKMDDTAKEDVVRTLEATALSGVFMVNVVGSSDDHTPHQQRAAQLAVAKALAPITNGDMDRKKP